MLGVDFGTSFSVAALRSDGGAPELVRFGRDLRMSSAVMVTDDGSLAVGVGVERRAADAPERVERTPKQRLGDGLVVLGDHEFKDVELVAAVLSQIGKQAQHQNNERAIDHVVLTHPVRWAKEGIRLQLLADAAAAVGWERVDYVPEPVAAALALAARGRLAEVPEEGLIAVYDLGGGTFDTAILQRTASGFELFGEPGGKEHLGGEMLDDALLDRLSGQLSSDDEDRWRDPRDSPEPTAWARAGFLLRDEVRRAKEDLVYEPELEIRLPAPFSTERLRLSHHDLQSTARQLIDQTADEMDATFRRNGKQADQIAAICLVGGSSQLAVVNRVLGQRFQRPVATWDDPKALTAEGAPLSVLIVGGSSAGETRQSPPAEPPPSSAAAADPGPAGPGSGGDPSPAEDETTEWLEERERQKRQRRRVELAPVSSMRTSSGTGEPASAAQLSANPEPSTVGLDAHGFTANVTKSTRTAREAAITSFDGSEAWKLVVRYNGLTSLKIYLDDKLVATFPMERHEFVRRFPLPLERGRVTHTVIVRVGCTLFGLAGITIASIDGVPILDDPLFEAQVLTYQKIG